MKAGSQLVAQGIDAHQYPVIAELIVEPADEGIVPLLRLGPGFPYTYEPALLSAAGYWAEYFLDPGRPPGANAPLLLLRRRDLYLYFL